MHHSDCGITRALEPPQLLEHYLGVQAGQLHTCCVMDPVESVRLDVAALKASRVLPGGYLVSGLVYDVATGQVSTVVQPEPVPELSESGR